jgi:hypothetical protein
MTTRIAEDGRLRVSKGYFSDGEYERSSRDALEKSNNPQLEHFIGYWLLENPDAGSYRAVEIGADSIVRNNRREPIRVEKAETNSLFLAHPAPFERFAVILSHAPGRRMAMKHRQYNDDGFVYRRVEKNEYDAVAATVTDPLAVIPGFWRSEEKIAGNDKGDMVHATAAFALNVRGKKGNAVDWASIHYILFRSRKATVEEGSFVIKDGLVANPVELVGQYGGGSSVQIRVAGPDTLEISTNGREYLRFVRCTQEEVVEYRKQIEAVY